MINCDYLYNKDFMNSTRPQSHFSNKKLHFRIIENGIILPHKNLPGTCGFGGVVDNTGNYIEESFVHTGIGGAYTPNEEIIESPASVIYLGMFVHIWGHCLTDGIKRTWFLNSDVYNKYFKNYPIVYIPMWGGIIPNFAQILKILEIDVGFLNAIVRPVRFRNIIIPDVAFFSQFTGVVELKISPGKISVRSRKKIFIFSTEGIKLVKSELPNISVQRAMKLFVPKNFR